MRRKLKNLKNKGGHSENGAPRQLIDEAAYRERRHGAPHFDSEYGGWSWASRPRDQAISLRSMGGSTGPSGSTGVTGATGPTPPTEFVDLLTAGDFAIFAQSGITTTGGSTVDGDMGINPAASASITGFALVLDGGGQFSTSSQVFPGVPPQLGHVFAPDYAVPAPAKVVLASADMITAYNDAIGRTPDTSSAGGDIAADSPLTAGFVYRYTGASSITAGPLTINGGAGDGIIIQVQGTLDIHQDVLLVGGILPENVFWAVTGQVTIFPGVTVNGEILGATGIAMQAGATLNGRALAQTAVTLISSTIAEV
jgi:hypothetical protein